MTFRFLYQDTFEPVFVGAAAFDPSGDHSWAFPVQNPALPVIPLQLGGSFEPVFIAFDPSGDSSWVFPTQVPELPVPPPSVSEHIVEPVYIDVADPTTALPEWLYPTQVPVLPLENIADTDARRFQQVFVPPVTPDELLPAHLYPVQIPVLPIPPASISEYYWDAVFIERADPTTALPEWLYPTQIPVLPLPNIAAYTHSFFFFDPFPWLTLERRRSLSTTMTMRLAAGDVIRGRIVRTEGSDDIYFAEDGSRLIIEGPYDQ